MSFISVSNLVEDGKQALKAGHYWSSLSIALALPSMCARQEFDDIKYKGLYFKTNKKDGRRQWFDKKAYIAWCQTYIRHYAAGFCGLWGKDFPSILYSLRCDMLHAGSADIVYNQKHICFVVNDSMITQLSDKTLIPMEQFCDSIFNDVAIWYRDSRHLYTAAIPCGIDDSPNTFVFDMQNKDDRLLYRKLCDKDHTEYLLEQFTAYEQRKGQ